MPIAYHVMLSLADRRAIFTTPEARADAYRRAVRIGERFGLGWFHLGSDHIHAVLFCSRVDEGRFAQAIESSWKQAARLEIGFAPHHPKAVSDQGHLRTLLAYVLRQDEHHGQRIDPFHVGSNGPDLCGGRIGGAAARELVRRFLPRVAVAEIERILVGGPMLRLEQLGSAPAGLVGEALEAHLRAAAASAVGRSDLSGVKPGVGMVRAAIVQLAHEFFPRSVDPARMLGVTEGARRRLNARPVDDAISRAVRWQVEFRLSKLMAGSDSGPGGRARRS